MNHVVAMPYPGRGHINPMMNLFHQIAPRTPDTLFTFILTEEWLGFIGSDPKPSNIRFATIPNVVPSELVRGADMPAFINAVMYNMVQPVQELLDRLQPNLIVADTFMPWAVGVGNRRNIPVASFWTMSASMFTMLYHFELLVQNRHYPVQVSERGEESVDYFPGLSPMKVADLPTIFSAPREFMQLAIDCFPLVHGAQFLLITTVYELEAEAIEALKTELKLPVYAIGPNIPYFRFNDNSSIGVANGNEANYLKWLNSKPSGTVLYVSLGSYLSVSSAQMDEIAAGLKESGVSYLWVARGETDRLNEVNGSGEGLVVPWCDQLKVLSHSAVGGFLSHCGWNSVKESIFAGVPMLTFPIIMDQVPNSKFIVDDWKNGWKMRHEWWAKSLVKREDIAELVRKFMDSESMERKEMMKKVKELKEICQKSVVEDGSANTNMDAFIRSISG